jgi:hypothetical protein
MTPFPLPINEDIVAECVSQHMIGLTPALWRLQIGGASRLVSFCVRDLPAHDIFLSVVGGPDDGAPAFSLRECRLAISFKRLCRRVDIELIGGYKVTDVRSEIVGSRIAFVPATDFLVRSEVVYV